MKTIAERASMNDIKHLRRMAARFAGRFAPADEIVSMVTAQMCRVRNEDTPVRAWSYHAVRYAALAVRRANMRRHKRESPVSLDTYNDGDNSDTEFRLPVQMPEQIDSVYLREVIARIDSLPEKWRQSLIMTALGHTCAATAETLGVTAMMTVHYNRQAREALRKLL